jgi:hypothetical protein
MMTDREKLDHFIMAALPKIVLAVESALVEAKEDTLAVLESLEKFKVRSKSDA